MNKPKCLFTEAIIRQRVQELGREITVHYAMLSGSIVVVLVMDGACVFAADLLREIKLDLTVVTVKVKTYEGQQSTRKPKIEGARAVQDLVLHESAHILIIEDIVDKGVTLWALAALFGRYQPLSMCAVVLLEKPTERRIKYMGEELPSWVGFECPRQFVVGYGMDLNGQYRNLPYVGVLGDD